MLRMTGCCVFKAQASCPKRDSAAAHTGSGAVFHLLSPAYRHQRHAAHHHALYFPRGSGAASPDGERAAARSESTCTLEELCLAARYLCRSGGSFFVVHRAERLADLFCTMRANAIEPKRLRLVSHHSGAAPSLALVEGRRDGGSGLTVEPELVLFDADGHESAECRRIYHKT